MKNSTNRGPSKGVVISILVVFVFFAGVILSLGYYYDSDDGQVAGDIDVSNSVELSQDYIKEFKQVFQNYLILQANADVVNDEFLNHTKVVKENLLKMRIPVEMKAIHLQSVIALDNIERGINSNNIDLIMDGIYNLRDIMSDLQ